MEAREARVAAHFDRVGLRPVHARDAVALGLREAGVGRGVDRIPSGHAERVRRALGQEHFTDAAGPALWGEREQGACKHRGARAAARIIARRSPDADSILGRDVELVAGLDVERLVPRVDVRARRR